jgi:hypothetical protein
LDSISRGPTLGGFIASAPEAGDAAIIVADKAHRDGIVRQPESRELNVVSAMAGNFAALSLRGTRPQISVYCCLPFFAHASIFLTKLAYVAVEPGI